jgi:hypothetical protein
MRGLLADPQNEDGYERMGKQEVHTGLRWGDLMVRVYLKDPGVDENIILY